SHPHADHYGGMSEVLDRYPARSFVYGGTPRSARTYRALLTEIDRLGIPVVTADTGVRRGVIVTADDSVVLTILAPPAACQPLAEVLALFAARAIPSYCTADQGTITIRVPRGGAWTVVPERPGTCHAGALRGGR